MPRKPKTNKTLTNFCIERLIKVSDNPQEIWRLTKDPENILRPNGQELNDIINELRRRYLSEEMTEEIYTKLIEGILYQ